MAMDHAAVAELLLRLVDEPELRADFIRDAVATSRDAGYVEIADEMAGADAKAAFTVDVRESKSSVAGVLMAAAVEGVVLAELLHQVAEHGGELAQIADHVTLQIKQVDLPVKVPGDHSGRAGVTPQAGGSQAETPAPPKTAEPPEPAAPPKTPEPPEPTAPPKTPEPPEPADEPQLKGDNSGARISTPDGGAQPAAPANAGAAPAGQPSADGNDTLGFRRDGARAARADHDASGADANDTLSFVPRQEAPAADAVAEPLSVGGPRDYPGDDASPEAFAAWMAAEARERNLPPELPVMASLVESGLKNLSGGDRDSVGFFQMRVGIWNEGAYEGYPDKPELQVKWFLDQAQSVRAQRIAAGRSVSDPHQFGEWIADVERPAAQYRGRYQVQLERAQHLVKAGSADATPQRVAARAASVDQSEPRAAPVASDPAAHSGPTTAHAAGKAALANPHLHFDATGVADLKAGRIDPRLIAVLTRLAKDHDLRISCMRSDHSKFTAGGSISNHWHGRGVDIAAVDGKTVNAGNDAARRVAEKLAGLDERYRPTEIGSPWAIAGPGYFTDGAHQDHLHVGFDDALPRSWKAPADVLPARAAEPQAVRADLATPRSADADAQVDTLSIPGRAERAARSGPSGQDASDTMSFPAPKPEPAAPSSDGQDGVVQPPGNDAPSAQDQQAARLGGSVADGAGGAGPQALAAVTEAKKYLGTPYLWGGSSPKTGFDCSGLVQWAYAKQGIRIPRVTYDQIDAPGAQKVGLHALRPGDLVFFAAGGDVHHVGMSLGGDRFIHAPHTGDVVKISRLSEPYYRQQFAGGRRFDQAAPSPEPAEAPAQRLAVTPATGDRGAAEAARVVDEADAQNSATLVFRALKRQEASFHAHTLQFMQPRDPGGARDLQASAARAGLDLGDVPRGPNAYPGNDASQQELARWLAEQARRKGLPPELPVMASLVESNVRNLPGGDADSVGFFQMRVSIWNQGVYAGYADKPELQARWFIDHALAVKRARIAAGDLRFGRDADHWGEWIADIERPAAQYRGRYQERLAEARGLLGR